MALAKTGDRVRIHFTGTLEDGTVFDTTAEEHGGTEPCDDDGCGCEAGPMDLTLGAGEFFAAVEKELVGMAAGETKTVTVPPDEAFGAYDEENVFTVPREDFPADLVPAIDMDLELTSDDGEEGMIATVIDVDEEMVTLDANHPLAGETLTFEIELLEILGSTH